jgi:hypothetical protein
MASLPSRMSLWGCRTSQVAPGQQKPIQRGNMVNGEHRTLRYMVTKLRKNSQEYGYHIQLAGSFKLRDTPSLLGSHIPSRAELEAFLRSRQLVDHTAEMILKDLDDLPPGREFYLLVYDS